MVEKQSVRSCGVLIRAVCFACLGSIWATGCGQAVAQESIATPSSPSSPKALIAQPCTLIRVESREAHGDSLDLVFLEVAGLSASDVPRPVGRWLVDHPVEVNHVASIMARNNIPFTMPWQHCEEVGCAPSEQWNLTLTPSLPPNTSEPLKLTIQFGRTGVVNGTDPMIVETFDQQPVVVDLPGTVSPDSAIVLTPYFLKSQDDLLQLFQCKVSAWEKGKHSTDSPPWTSPARVTPHGQLGPSVD